MRKNGLKKTALIMTLLMLVYGVTACSGKSEPVGTEGKNSTVGEMDKTNMETDMPDVTTSADGKNVVRVCVTADPGSLGTFDEGSSCLLYTS